MRNLLLVISTSLAMTCFGQSSNVVGTFNNKIPGTRVSVTFNADSTFSYTSAEHPIFYRWEGFSENGKWAQSGDTVILNPQLSKIPFVESDLQEQEDPNVSDMLLTFNHIKRYYDNDGKIIRTDTVQVQRLDYAFNEFRKKDRIRVADHRTTRCTFAGYIPKEVITTSRTIHAQRPTEPLKSIFIGCWEMQGTKEFAIRNSNSNHLTLNVYSNYYQNGELRQVKFLLKKNGSSLQVCKGSLPNTPDVALLKAKEKRS